MLSVALARFQKHHAVFALTRAITLTAVLAIVFVDSSSADQTAPPKPAANPDATTAGKAATPALVLNNEDVASALGQPVYSAAGESMGRVTDILVDRKAAIRAAIIDFGGFLGVGTRKVAVDWQALHFPPQGNLDRLILSLTRKEVSVAPEYKPGEPIVVLGAAVSSAQGQNSKAASSSLAHSPQ
jgi:hypothetical protein